MAAKKLRVYSVTQEDMTSYFATKRAARRFNSLHDEPQEIVTHEYTAEQLAALLKECECSAHSTGDAR